MSTSEPAGAAGAAGAETDDDAPDTEDTVAELDDDPDLEAADTGDEDGEEPELFSGSCTGGPWDGRGVTVRYPLGFLLVDKPNGVVWLYDRQPDGKFVCRDEQPRALQDEGADNRWRAADEGDYDILTLDAETEPAGGPT
jgi:hypothetical protein